jgi:zinc protease
VVNVILENIARLQGSPGDIQQDWFERAKKMIVTSEAMDNETAAQQAQSAAMDELLGLGFNHHEKFANKINNVRMSDVQEMSALLLRRCIVTVSTNHPEAVTIKEGSRTYRSFPPVDLTPRGVQHDSK